MKFDEATGWWMPDPETHLQEWMVSQQDRRGDRLLYQGAKYRAALDLCESRRVAVDIGAHVGLWSWQMAQDFDRVVCFEPVPVHRACWAQNMDGFGDAILHPYALGEAPGIAHLAPPEAHSTGGTRINRAGSGIEAEVRTLDGFGIERVDFLKLDCEGYELFALRGGLETIREWKPVIVCEQKPETGGMQEFGVTAADMKALLEPLGYRVRRVIQGDYILTVD